MPGEPFLGTRHGLDPRWLNIQNTCPERGASALLAGVFRSAEVDKACEIPAAVDAEKELEEVA